MPRRRPCRANREKEEPAIDRAASAPLFDPNVPLPDWLLEHFLRRDLPATHPQRKRLAALQASDHADHHSHRRPAILARIFNAHRAEIMAAWAEVPAPKHRDPWGIHYETRGRELRHLLDVEPADDAE